MKKGLSVGLLLIFNILFISLYGQEDISLPQDSVHADQPPLILGDTLTNAEAIRLNKEVDLKLVKEFRPNPSKAVLYSAIFPGLGQIYNRKYWKLPIVYGGFLGIVYAVTWNGNMYSDYNNAYMDIMTDPRNRTRWKEFVRDPQDILDRENFTPTANFLKGRRDYFRRNRDLAIIIGVGLYALCMIDAYVDAHLYNFTVTPDLSMTMAPVVWGPSNFSGSVSVGIQCNIVF